MEDIGSDPFTVFGSIHGAQPGTPDGYGLTAKAHSRTSLASGLSCVWRGLEPNEIVFTLDGVAYADRTPQSLAGGQKWEFNQPFYLLLNLAVGGTWPGSDAATQFPATMLVDWVRVYS